MLEVEVAFNSDYARSAGNPEPYLRRMAAAGFSAVHWCHHWIGEHRYSQAEIGRIAAMLRRYGLRMIDLHGAVGLFSDWTSGNELRRRAGVGLIKNRIDMTAELGGNAVVLHLPEGRLRDKGLLKPVRKSLEEVETAAREAGVRIALENLPTPGHMEFVLEVIEEYPAEYLGLCYDSGHGNMAGNGLELLETMLVEGGEKQQDNTVTRLAAMHLHDNAGRRDLHVPPFEGNIDWERLTSILAYAYRAGYTKPICLECSIRHSVYERNSSGEDEFLRNSLKAGQRLVKMMEAAGGPG